jgi:plastocyanin
MKWRNSLVGILTSVPVAGCTSTSASSPAVTTSVTSGAAGVTINLTISNQFQPATLTVARGTTVTWVNTGLAPHTVTDDASKAAKPTDALLPSGAQAWTRAC